MTNNKKVTLAVIAAIIANTVWGLSVTFSKYALFHASPFVLLAYRYTLAFLMLNLFRFFGKQKVTFKGKKFGTILMFGIFEPIIYYTASNYALVFVSSTFSGIMNALVPVFVLFSSALFLNERPTKLQLLFCVLSIVCVIIVGLQGPASGSTHLLGVVLLLISVFSSVAYNTVSRVVSCDFTAFERTYFMTLLASVFFVTAALIENCHDLSALIQPLHHKEFVISFLYLGCISSPVAYFAQNYANTYLPIYRTTSFSNLIMAFSIIGGVLFLHEPFNLISILCAVFILASIWGIQKFSAPNAAVEYKR